MFGVQIALLAAALAPFQTKTDSCVSKISVYIWK